jgi:hypothetical protein
MAYIRIILLTAILVAFTCVGFFSFAQKVQDVKVGSQAVSDLPLFLNGEAVGTIGNTTVLESRLGSLPGGLKSNINGADGLPNIGRMVFVADDQLSMSALGDAWDKIDDYFDYPHYTKMALWAGNSCEADRTPSGAGSSVLVLSNVKLSIEELKKYRGTESCWIRAEFTLLKGASAYSARVLKSYRTAVTSFEVTESGAYLINEQVQNPKLRASPIANLGHPALRRAVDAAPIKPRSVDPALLDKEIDVWIKLRESEGPIGMSAAEEDPSVDLPLIISGKISYAALVPILKRLKKQRNRLSIVVNDLQPNTAARPN